MKTKLISSIIICSIFLFACQATQQQQTHEPKPDKKVKITLPLSENSPPAVGIGQEKIELSPSQNVLFDFDKGTGNGKVILVVEGLVDEDACVSPQNCPILQVVSPFASGDFIILLNKSNSRKKQLTISSTAPEGTYKYMIIDATGKDKSVTRPPLDPYIKIKPSFN